MTPRILGCVALAILALSACRKTESLVYASDGEILEADGRLCGTCGGYFVRIDNSSSEYRTFSLPGGSGIDLVNDPKPIPVSLNWQPDTGLKGRTGVIIVTAIKRR